MTLSQGTRLGPYEIAGLLGAGGMGEVYRAVDTNLKRDVALKVLPADVATDRGRLARFQREAEVLASLNHPHIAHVYGLEFPPEGHHRFALVMELVEGEDLSQRLDRGAMSLDEALPIARQIAEALEAAHEAGIVHRDLKPANIKVRSDGSVKVLDFGLAKALDAVEKLVSGEGANSPTITSPALTQRGVILGTAAYMSPEQARGKPVDKRTDVWAFGVILYEMLTGQRPFKGETVSDSVAAILKTDPDWNALPAETPFLIKRLLRHCLNRDPRERLGDIRDARIEIAEALTTSVAVEPPTPASRHGTAWIVAAASLAVAVAVVGATVAGWRPFQAATAEPDVVRFSFLPPPGVRPTGRPAISPDGRHVAFVGTDSSGVFALWVHSLNAGASRRVPGTERIVYQASVFWSPDSRSIGFFADGKLKRIDLDLGAPVVICDAANGRGGAWNQRGDILFSLVDGPLLRVHATGGTPSPATTLESGARSHRVPHFLSDGQHFVFTAVVGQDVPLLLGSLESGAIRSLGSVQALAGTAPPDRVLFVAGGQLVAQRVDIGAGALVGDRTPLGDVGVQGLSPAWASASATGVLSYRRNAAGGKVVLAWVDRRGTVSRLDLPAGSYGDPSLSPDGRQLALSIRDESGEHVWVHDLERGTLGKRTFENVNTYPIWSRDGSSLTYSNGAGQVGPLLQTPANGSAGGSVLINDDNPPGQKIATSWSAEGHLAFQAQTDVLVRERDGTIRPALNSPAFEREARFAPDGRWFAYRSDESGRDEVYVQSYPPGSGKWQISTAGGAQPMWSPDGKELFYKIGNRLMAVAVELRPTFKPSVPRLLFEIPLPERTIGDPSRYAVSPDGQRFLVTTTDIDDSAMVDAPVHVILNWPSAISGRSQ